MLNSKRIQKVFAVFALVAFLGTSALTSTSEAATPPPPAKQSQAQRPQGNPGNKPSMQQRPQQNNRPQQNKKPQMRKDDRRPAPAPVSHTSYRRPAPRDYRDHESHSDTGNLVTGLIIGGVLGAIIANNS